MNRVLRTAVCLIAIAIPNLFGQSDNAQVSGFVRDASRSGVPSAVVALKNEGTGLERRTVANESGYYVIPNVPPGMYTISVEAKGFKTFQKTGNKLDPNMAATINADLEVGAVTETVNVVASAATVQSETATVGKLIESKQIQFMQLNGRNPIFLAALNPGVRSDSSLARFGFGLDSGGFNINGGRTQDVLITYDGAVGIRTRANGTSVGTADADAVQEVQVLTANYNAEYGRSSGGQIRVVTKSGTRAFHGDFYEYFRNSALNANTWTRNHGTPVQASGPDPFRYNQFGYQLNGPIYIPKVFNKDRNRFFFLWGQEWVRQRQGQTVTNAVPSLGMRNGDFSELLNATNQLYGRRIVINDPTTGQPFPNNVIPQNRLSTNGVAFLRAYPEPVAGFAQGKNNYIASRPTLTDQRKDTVSIDVNPTDKHQVRFRHQNFAFVDTSAFRADTDRAPQIIDRPNKTVSLNWVYMMSPTLINEFLATTSVDRVYIAVDTRGGRYQRSAYGINYPYIFPDRKEIFDKIPTIKLSNFTDLDGGPYPSQSTGPIYDFSNNITKIHGNHTFKAGFLFERSGQNDFDQINVQGVPGGTNNQNGQFIFDDSRTGGATTGLAAANAALGLFTTYAEIGVRSYTPYRGQMYEWFVQDSWKATSKLRLELGLRHSIIQPYESLWRNMDVFDPNFYDPSKAAPMDPRTGYVLTGDLQSRYNGIVIPGSGFTDAAKGRIPIADTGQFDFLFRDVGKRYSKTHYKDFQPRVGVAYSVTPKMVVRAGAGRFMTRPGVSDSVFLGGNPPFQPMVSISNGVADNPGGGSNNNFPLSLTSQDPVFPNPTAYAWNAMVERELASSTVLSVGYVGRRGLHLPRERNINQLQPGTLQANPGVNPDFLRPYKGFGVIRVTNNEANSNYNGLQVNLTRRFSQGLSFGVAYTLSKSSDDGSNPRDIIPNAFDARPLWGPSAYDTRNVLVVNWIYELPVFRNPATVAGKVLGGWQVTGVTQFQSGTPFTVGTNEDVAGVGGVGRLDGNHTDGSKRDMQIWNINGDPVLPRGDRQFSNGAGDQNYWFRVRNDDGSPIFVKPAAGTFSTARNRNLVYAPGLQNWNLGLFKSFYVTEKQRVTFRAEAFNWVNHPNVGGENGGRGGGGGNGVDITPTSSTFGKVTSKGGQRTLQLSLRYSF